MIKTAMDIKKKVIDIIANELKLPSEKINDETSMQNTAEWDSLALINIISKIYIVMITILLRQKNLDFFMSLHASLVKELIFC